MKALLACCVLCVSIGTSAQDPAPVIIGNVTRVASASDFDVNGWRIACGSATWTSELLLPAHSGPRAYRAGCPQELPRLGLPVRGWGHLQKKKRAVTATQLDLGPVPLEDLSSYGIIEKVISQTSQSLVVRSDGFTIRIPASAHLQFRAPLHSLAEVGANVWLAYIGEQQADGIIVAREAGFTPSLPNPKAEKTRTRTDYDPTAVTKQGSPALEAVIGVNAMKIPTLPDAAMQSRVAAVGKKLIPAYQRDLPVDDGTKINFRFYVTAGDHWMSSVLSLPSGIILVPYQAVERMQNDSQLAAILADSIAIEMEAQDYRMLRGVRPTGKQEAARATKETAIYTLAPRLGVVGVALEKRELDREEQQSGRVSLTLMHDAGFDVAEAPVAWWRLSEHEGKPLADTPLPNQSRNLYRDLAATWATVLTSPSQP